MKKFLSLYLFILIGVFAVLSLIDQKSDYVVERKIWNIERQKAEIAKDPNVVPDREFERVIKQYRDLIDKHPDSPLIPPAHIRIGEVYALKKDYERAREIFFGLHDLYPDNQEILAMALFEAGKTYELQNNWPEAIKIYRRLFVEYPVTKTGLRAPLYIANYYRSQNDLQGTMGAYEFAIQQYKRVADSHENSSVGLRAMRHLAQCYHDQNRWKEAIGVMGATLEKYSTSPYLTVEEVDTIIKSINITAAYRLKDYGAATSLYKDMIKRNPNHPLNHYLIRTIDAFDKLTERGVDVSEGM